MADVSVAYSILAFGAILRSFIFVLSLLWYMIRIIKNNMIIIMMKKKKKYGVEFSSFY